MTDLITQLEAAPEGSRELDVEIGRLVGLKIHGEFWQIVPGVMEPDHKAVIPIPFYTYSIDCALTLVPEDWIVSISKRADTHWVGEPYKYHWYAHMDLYEHNEENSLSGCERITSSGAAPSPALALCIASLKARAK